MAFRINCSKMSSILPLIFSMMVCLGAAIPSKAPNTAVTGDKRDAAVGKASVFNNCSFAVHSNIVHGTGAGGEATPEEIVQVLEPSQSLSHPFSHDAQVGVSWKIWREDTDNTNPVQFEYTWIPGSKRTWYDLSMIDAGEAERLDGSDEELVPDADGYGDYTGDVAISYSFQEYGMTLSPLVGGQEVTEGNCLGVKCKAGEEYCTGAYNTWDDWGQQHDCDESVDLTLVLCG